uniref:F-box protein At5g07610-like n=1 Tax=Erigeron canadensis TaxID=72917 RepID=UPI001CB95685|nr:F-box protein At5g07610-like [Erigeron canadensis]
MVNTRGKIRKAQHTRKICFSEASVADNDQEMTRSGALIGSNDDLITDIFRRLPVTSILRFKSVSKRLLSLLSHRRFTVPYDNISISPGIFIRNLYMPFDVESQKTPPFRRLDFYPDLKGIRIVQSCNGLLLCCSDLGNERARKYYVFNPTTKQFAIIPSVPGGRDVRRSVCFMGLAYHRTDCVHYKVVCIHRAKPEVVVNVPAEDLYHIKIYSSDTRKWKITDQSLYAPYFSAFKCGVYWNGAIHWVPSCRNPMYFKLDTEQLQKLSLRIRMASLGDYHDGPMPIYFGESRGHLHLVEKPHHENRLQLNVYEMLNDHSGWFVKYQVDLAELPGTYPGMAHSYLHPSSPHYYEFDILDVVRGEKEEDTFMVVRVPEKIIRYNIMDKNFKQIFDATNVFYGRIRSSEAHRYIEALTLF